MCKHSSKQSVHLEDYHVMFFLLNKRKRALLPVMDVLTYQSFLKNSLSVMLEIRRWNCFIFWGIFTHVWLIIRPCQFEIHLDYLRSVIFKIILESLVDIFTYAFLTDNSLQIHIGFFFFQTFVLRLHLLRLVPTFVV